MNESKIRLLADEASEWCKKNAHGAPAAWDWEYKFAELIIKECIKAIDDGDGSLSSVAEHSWREICASEIKQHFGIE